MKRFYLMRHGDAAVDGPRGDHSRPLTAHGVEQAHAAGARLADAGVQSVIASSAVRARQTAEELGLGEVTVHDELYNAGPRALASALTGLPQEVQAAVLVAHLPGIPDLAAQLSGDDPALEQGYPTATIAVFELDGAWADLDQARLVEVLRH